MKKNYSWKKVKRVLAITLSMALMLNLILNHLIIAGAAQENNSNSALEESQKEHIVPEETGTGVGETKPGSSSASEGSVDESVPSGNPSGEGAAGEKPSDEGTASENPAGGGTAGENPTGGGTAGENPSGEGATGEKPAGGGTAGENPSGSGTTVEKPAGGDLASGNSSGEGPTSEDLVNKDTSNGQKGEGPKNEGTSSEGSTNEGKVLPNIVPDANAKTGVISTVQVKIQNKNGQAINTKIKRVLWADKEVATSQITSEGILKLTNVEQSTARTLIVEFTDTYATAAKAITWSSEGQTESITAYAIPTLSEFTIGTELNNTEVEQGIHNLYSGNEYMDLSLKLNENVSDLVGESSSSVTWSSSSSQLTLITTENSATKETIKLKVNGEIATKTEVTITAKIAYVSNGTIAYISREMKVNLQPKVNLTMEHFKFFHGEKEVAPIKIENQLWVTSAIEQIQLLQVGYDQYKTKDSSNWSDLEPSQKFSLNQLPIEFRNRTTTKSTTQIGSETFNIIQTDELAPVIGTIETDKNEKLYKNEDYQLRAEVQDFGIGVEHVSYAEIEQGADLSHANISWKEMEKEDTNKDTYISNIAIDKEKSDQTIYYAIKAVDKLGNVSFKAQAEPVKVDITPITRGSEEITFTPDLKKGNNGNYFDVNEKYNLMFPIEISAKDIEELGVTHESVQNIKVNYAFKKEGSSTAFQNGSVELSEKPTKVGKMNVDVPMNLNIKDYTGKIICKLTVVDPVGNESTSIEQEFYIDHELPELAYIKMLSEEKNNDEIIKQDKNLWQKVTTAIQGFFKVKKTEQVQVQVATIDAASGVDRIEFTYKSELENEESVTVKSTDSNVTLKKGAIAKEDGTFATGKILVTEIPASIKANITEVTIYDIAGNCNKLDVIDNDYQDPAGFIIDNQDPTLSVTFPEGTHGNDIHKQVLFVENQNSTLGFEIEEDNWKYKDQADVSIKKKIATYDSEANVSYAWDDVTSQILNDLKWNEEGKLDIPFTENGWYKVTVSYTDIADNVLIGQGVENGVYTKEIVVNALPVVEITDMKLVGSEGNKVEGITFYNEDTKPTLEFTVKNEPYFDKESALFTKKVQNKMDDEVSVDAMEDIRWSYNKDTGEFTGTVDVNYKTDGTEDGDYKFQMDYKDHKGTPVKSATLDKVMVDTKKPSLEVSYDKEPVKVSEDFGDEFAEPVTITICIDEQNFKYFTEDAVLDNFLNLNLKVEDVINENAKAEEIKAEKIKSDFEKYFKQLNNWNRSEDSNAYKATYTLEYDATYELSVSYKDYANHEAEKVQSKKFLLDVTGPTIQSITTTPENTFYYNDTYTLVTEVEDGNAGMESVESVWYAEVSEKSMEGIENNEKIVWTEMKKGTDNNYQIEIEKPTKTPTEDRAIRYAIKAIDKLGNISYKIKSELVYTDFNALEVGDILFSKEFVNGYFNIEHMSNDGGVNLILPLEITQYDIDELRSDKNRAIKVDYSFIKGESNEDIKEEMKLGESTSINIVNYSELTAGQQYNVNIPLNDQVKSYSGKVTCKIEITDPIGNKSSTLFKTFQIDSKTPELGYIKMISERMDNGQIIKQEENLWQKIKTAIDGFFKFKKTEKVQVQVATTDATSGVDRIEFTYKSELENEEAVTVKSTDSNVTIKEGAIANEDGTLVSGKILVTEIPASIKAKITTVTITDCAGNSNTIEANKAGYDSTAGFIIDNQDPTLSVTLPEGTKGNGINEEVLFVDNYDQTLELQISEDNWKYRDHTKDHAVVSIRKKIATYDTEANVTYGWDDVKFKIPKDKKWNEEGKLDIPFTENGWYEISVSYTDIADNALVGDGVENGTYTKQIVVNTLSAVEVTDMKLVYSEEKKGNKVGDITFYNKATKPTLEFTVKHEPYFDKKRANFTKISQNKMDDKVSVDAKEDISWSYNKDTKEFKGTVAVNYKTDGTEDGDYKFQADYKDHKGTPIKSATLDKVMVDTQKPILNVEYINYSNKQTTKDPEDAESYDYLDDSTEIKISITEQNFKYFNEKNNFRDLFNKYLKIEIDVTESFENAEGIEKEFKEYFSNPDNWDVVSGTDTYVAKYKLEKEAKYKFHAEYKDYALNEEISETKNFVIDKRAPMCEISYYDENGAQTKPERTENHRDFYKKNVVKAKITIKERNFNSRMQEDITASIRQTLEASNHLSAVGSDALVSMFQDNKQTQKWTHSGDIHTLEVPFRESSATNYIWNFHYVDLAKHPMTINGKKGTYTRNLTLDTSNPELGVTFSSSSQFVDTKYSDFNFFGQQIIFANIASADKQSAIKQIQYRILDENKNAVTDWIKVTNKRFYTNDVPTKDTFSHIVTFNSNFKGYIQTWTENGTKLDKYVNPRGSIVENDEKHSAAGYMKITPVRQPNAKGFYNSDVAVTIDLKDTYSGISSYIWQAGVHNGSENFAQLANDNPDTYAVIWEKRIEQNISASANNNNHVKLSLDYIDNTGRMDKLPEEEYKIDITAPEVTVTYDNNAPVNQKYYNKTRTATVTVKDRNFDTTDANDWKFIWTSTGGAPSIGGWHLVSGTPGETDETYWAANVTFSADADYTFTFQCEDMADNASNYTRVDTFTVDQTKPVIKVSYDNNSVKNGKYYKEARTGSIDITEHNFNASEVKTSITAQIAEGNVATPSVTGWGGAGDTHTASVSYSNDGDYTFDIAYTDLAGNVAEVYAQDSFVIDKTKPTVEITGVKDRSANKGEVVPGLKYEDINYDAETVEIAYYGANNGVIQIPNSSRTETNHGQIIQLEDIAHEKAYDDLYTMKAKVADKAGNEESTEVMFSVNRFGSVYVLEENTADLIKNYYTNQEQDIVVREINADELKKHEVSYNHDGELVTLQSGDYTFDDSDAQMETQWKEYSYKIKKENFETEGNYTVTIYSEDKASNNSNTYDRLYSGKETGTKMNEQNLEFVVDKTKPTIVITGVENEKQYNDATRTINIDTKDNIKLESVDVVLNGKTTTYDTQKLSDTNGMLTVTVSGKNKWQKLDVIALDKAGNKKKINDIKFLITTNLFVQYYMNKPVLYGSVGTLATSIAAAGYFILRRRKKMRG